MRGRKWSCKNKRKKSLVKLNQTGKFGTSVFMLAIRLFLGACVLLVWDQAIKLRSSLSLALLLNLTSSLFPSSKREPASAMRNDTPSDGHSSQAAGKYLFY